MFKTSLLSWLFFFMSYALNEPTNEGGTLAQELVNRVGTDICRDIALSFKLWIHRLSLAQHNDQVKKRFFASYPEAADFITNKFNVKNFTNQEDVSPFKFKIRIVQSSTVGVSEYLDNFSSGQIVIQSDPLVSGVTKIQWPSHTEKIVEDYQSGNDSADPGWIARLNTPFVCHPILASGSPWQIKIKSSDFLQRSFTCVLYEIKGGS